MPEQDPASPVTDVTTADASTSPTATAAGGPGGGPGGSPEGAASGRRARLAAVLGTSPLARPARAVWRQRHRLAPLSTRLVLTAVALVVAISVVIGGVATVAVHAYLMGQLDDDVTAALDRSAKFPGISAGSLGEAPPDDGRDSSTDQRDDDRGFGQGFGSMEAYFLGDGYVNSDGTTEAGVVITQGSDGAASFSLLSGEALEQLSDLDTDGTPVTVRVAGQGEYRVAATQTVYGVAVAGLPVGDVEDVVRTLLAWEVALILGGAVVATGAGLVLVRRQLRPLKEVAETAHTVATLPLSSGEIDLDERVPDHLTDARTEVGQVGAALNTLLEHVETSLSARHRSEQQVRQFVADASHELRTPLATIAGYAELARRRPDDAGAQRLALAKVEEESARMTALVQDLLLLARLDAGRPLERRPVDLTRMLLEAVSDARVVSPAHEWRLELADEAVEVVGDELRLHQVLTNLLTNARKYTPEGSTVTVAALPDGFTVHDDGPGFPAELVGHAFERFVRGDQARNREGGAGLGLSLVRAIVSAHGGTVTLRSVPGDTTIEVRLPVA
ncbi:sensor histidine kinase [Nocardioides bruguierae]|uniref:sensor histidine kinase n=1 Tax=Nocardioides bruguierae TaxID=2945102 RepID=UPI0020209F27|nr:HAMP domain-containing sensor histidine kinase [Nocardioides bruguierae]MCL8025088.1 HAMP domain-containing histidine kinase [Nocardioides bruguierae]